MTNTPDNTNTVNSLTNSHINSLTKEQVIELARQAGLVYNEETHPLGILRHHRKALYKFANLIIENYTKSKESESNTETHRI